MGLQADEDDDLNLWSIGDAGTGDTRLFMSLQPSSNLIIGHFSFFLLGRGLWWPCGDSVRETVSPW
jgi:hypothetical protein